MAIIGKYRWNEDDSGNKTNVHIDDALCAFDNFIGYKGNPPTNATEFANLEPMGGTQSQTVWKEGTDAPTWAEVQAKQTELTTDGQSEIDTKISAYRKLSLTDAEINAIDPKLLEG